MVNLQKGQNMKANFENLGFRERWKLLQFITFIEFECHFTDYDIDFGYDLKYDEPFYSFGFSKIYATDHDLTFDASNNMYVNEIPLHEWMELQEV